MTSTLPNFPASPAALTPTGGNLNPLCAGVVPLGAEAPDGVPADFARLLGEGQATAVNLPPVLTVPTKVSAGTMAVVFAPLETGSVESLVELPVETPATSREPTRGEVELAAAFAAVVMQALQPAPMPGEPRVAVPVQAIEPPSLPVGELPANVPTVLPGAVCAGGKAKTPIQTDPRPSMPVVAGPVIETPVEGDAAEMPAPSTETEDFTLPNGRPFPTTLPEQARAALAMADKTKAESAGPQVELPDQASEVAREAVAKQPAVTAEMSAITVAQDGALECRMELAPIAKTRPAGSDKMDLEIETPAMEVQAELELPGQAVVRVEVRLPLASEQGQGRAAGLPVNFAALAGLKNHENQNTGNSVERNFVFTGDKEVKPESAKAGISVAKSEPTMSAVPTEEIRHARNPENFSVLPARADFQVAQPVAERITAEPVAPAGHNFAERAVATVANLAEAQFTASMQRAGSVQLRLKFGSEDLAVRVEMRGGLVHTDFRTDSPALREAIATEWQAVAAASPGQLQRFLDPVFSPATPGASADAGAQHQSSQRQAQQQAQEQSAARQDAWAGLSSFSRRSPNGSFTPEPAAPRVPVLLPTSLRLSALA